MLAWRDRHLHKTHRQLGANVKGDGCRHGDGHEGRVSLGQHIAQDADEDRRKKEPDAHLDAVLGQRRDPLQRSFAIEQRAQESSGLALR